MRKAIAVFMLMTLVLGTGNAEERDNIDEFYVSLKDALLDMGMTPEDFMIRNDYADPDVFRLPLIDSLMYDPADLLSRMDGLAASIEAAPSLHACAGLLWGAMSVEPDETPATAGPIPNLKDLAGQLAHLPSTFSEAIVDYLRSLEKLAGFREAAIARIGPDLDFIRGSMPTLLAPSQEYDEIGPFELHHLEQEEEALNDSVLLVLETVDMGAVAAMALEALRSAGNAESKLAHAFSGADRLQCYGGREVEFSDCLASVEGRVVYMGLTPWGPLVVGDTSNTVYNGCFALIIDPGGDDTYNLTHHDDVHFRLVIDGGGNDTYRSPDSSGIAGAILGTSVVLDLAGDDSYVGREISLGAGICGLGVLDDRQGNDSYISGVFSQGAGFLGLGILRDGGGHDSYVAGMQSQAFGYVMGSGLLLECDGNDTYHTRMLQTDILRYDDHYLTLSQGCAFGSRPDHSGGIGLLIDSRGNDLYFSDIFGQGVAYWFAVGALIDRGGHDRYCSYQYAQGAGIHLAFGLLLDSGGDDGYLSKGVSQGCGHDLSLGLLADFSGNDWYTATDLSQGAGNANGTGIIYDADGNDAFAAKSETNVNGYGNYRREFGSIGLHVDSRGKDFYSARGENGSLWESGRYGLGVDVPGEATRPSGDIVVKEYPFKKREFSSEELFILCARGEPRFREWRQYAFDRMVEDTLGTIAYLRTVLDTKDARERHTIKDILREIGEPAVPMLADAVREDDPLAKSEASWILGIIGSREAFDVLLDLSLAEDWKQRSSAVNAIGKLGDLTQDDLDRLQARLNEILADTGEVVYVRKDAAYAAGAQGMCASLGLLVGALDDPHYAVRFAAAEAIRDLSEGSCEEAADELIAWLPGASAVGLAAALYAAGELPPDKKLDIADAVMALPGSPPPGGEVALAKLVGGIVPETTRHSKRLEAIKGRLTEDSWKVRAFFGTD